MSKKTGLELLRVPFPKNQIGKLPKPTKKQTEEARAPKWNGIKCNICGAWHHKDVVHLDYVGHAALTDRLLDVDPQWIWEPLAFTDNGLPAFDKSGGLWIKLTICGVTRLGYGNAAESNFKEVGSREKEIIGDALRNASMRFGAALDLWHKGALHIDLDDKPQTPPPIIKPVRSTVNTTLGNITDRKKFDTTQAGFEKKYGVDIWQQKTGHKNETWEQLFVNHFERVNKKTEPNPQELFDSLLADRTQAGYDAVCEHYDNNKSIQNTKNETELLNLNEEVNNE